MKRRRLIFTLCLSSVSCLVLISACSGAKTSISLDEPLITQGNGQSTDESLVISPGLPETAETENPAPTIITPEISPTMQNSPLASTTESKPTLEVKVELEATNPFSVQLAAGHPQLVEFFAFW